MEKVSHDTMLDNGMHCISHSPRDKRPAKRARIDAGAAGCANLSKELSPAASSCSISEVKIHEKRIKSSDERCLYWQPNALFTFEKRIEHLKSFKEKHGHVRVTMRQDEHLAVFCRSIGLARQHPGSKMILTEERIKAWTSWTF